MRLNEPNSQREHALPANATLMSTTDVHSRIAYANDAFIEVSGFAREELQGQPHNIVRHPDMPVEAFADMWATLKGGEPWTALVKNRRKDGDHYWVRANAVPVVRDGRTAGYLSVRTVPQRNEIEAAERLYRALREGKAGALRLHKGLVVRGGALAWTSLWHTMSVRWRMRSALALLLPALIVGPWALGLSTASLLGWAGLAAGALLAVGWMLESQIARPLENLREQALRVATGASHAATPANRVDEIGMTQRAIGQLGLMFRWLIDDVSAQVIRVEAAIAEIAQGNQDLSVRTAQAAASVEETAASMEQMNASVRNTAESAQLADRVSATATDAATAGGRVVSEVVSTMNEISTSASKIASIIGMIDGIAFQTNILALNAAVEAARAGEQGRGFAVVAGEVRSLAQRSAEAAKEIKSLIGISVERVEAGSRLADGAGRTMGDIVEQIKRVSDLIHQMSSAHHEQGSSIAQVSQAVGQLDQVTQQNAALVEQSAAASESLSQQAARLVQAIQVFR